MKNLLAILTLTGLVIMGCGQSEVTNIIKAPDGDGLTTKEAILKHIQNERGGIDVGDVCVDEVPDIPELFIVGFFAHDRGCGGAEYYFKGKKVTLDEKTIQSILDNADFQKNKLAAVEAYHSEIANHYQHCLSSKPEDFSEAEFPFTEPETTMEGDHIISKMWVQERAGMLPEVRFYLSTLTMDSKGKLLDHSTSSHFTAEY